MTDLDARQRQTLRAAQDWFVTPVDGFPSPARADPDERVLDLVLAEVEPLLTELADVLDAGNSADVGAWLQSLESDNPAGFDLVRLVCLGRYLSSPPVWDVLGYRGRRPAPIRPGEAEEYLDGLLEQPRRRGKVYRPTPPQEPPVPPPV